MTELMPPAEARALAAMDEVRREIIIAKSTGDVATLSEWRDRAAAILHYTRMRDGGQEAANDAGEVKVRAEAALGAIDREANPPSPGVATAGVATPDVSPTTRAAWRKLGALNDEHLDAAIAQTRDHNKRGVTTTAVLNATGNGKPPKRIIGHPPRNLRRELIEWFGQGRLILRLLNNDDAIQDLPAEVRRDLAVDVEPMKQLIQQLQEEL